MLVTDAQLCALYAMRKSAPVFDLDEDLVGRRLVVTTPDGTRRLIDQGGAAHLVTTQPAVHVDGDRITAGTGGCMCGPRCEMPCWQRVGITDQPCCQTCAPLPPPDHPDLDD